MTAPAEPAPAPAESCARALRSDAERNRERILAAARQAYALEGLDVSMAEVARRAEVGVATLFRRFPTREDLIAAVFAGTMDTYADTVATALEDPDPWHGFTTHLETICAMQAADRGFAAVLTGSFPRAKALEAKRAEVYRLYVELIARAKETGRLRADFSPEDFILLLAANSGVIAAIGGVAPDAWRRLVAYLLQAFAIQQPDPLPPPPSPTAIYRAIITDRSRR